jgi:DNA-binding NarL/FixJ family response regulator
MPEVEGHPVSVLVVDDLAAARRAAAEVVAATDGFELTGSVGTGEEAMKFLAGGLVDLVLMDVTMPGMGGIEACLRIRRRHPRVVVVLLSICQAEGLPIAVRRPDIGFCGKDGFGPEELEAQWRTRSAQR